MSKGRGNRFGNRLGLTGRSSTSAKIVPKDGPGDAVQLGAVAEVIVGHFLPVEWGDSAVLILQHLLPTQPVDEVAPDVRREVEAWRKFLFDALQIEVCFPSEVSVGVEQDVQPLDAGHGVVPEGAFGSFARVVEAATLSTDGVDPLGQESRVDQSGHGGDEFLAAGELVAAGGEEVLADEILDREDGSVIHDPTLSLVVPSLDAPVGLLFSGVGAQGQNHRRLSCCDGGGDLAEAVGSAKLEDGIFLDAGRSVLEGQALVGIPKIMKASRRGLLLEEKDGHVSQAHLGAIHGRDMARDVVARSGGIPSDPEAAITCILDESPLLVLLPQGSARGALVAGRVTHSVEIPCAMLVAEILAPLYLVKLQWRCLAAGRAGDVQPVLAACEELLPDRAGLDRRRAGQDGLADGFVEIHSGHRQLERRGLGRRGVGPLIHLIAKEPAHGAGGKVGLGVGPRQLDCAALELHFGFLEQIRIVWHDRPKRGAGSHARDEFAFAPALGILGGRGHIQHRTRLLGDAILDQVRHQGGAADLSTLHKGELPDFVISEPVMELLQVGGEIARIPPWARRESGVEDDLPLSPCQRVRFLSRLPQGDQITLQSL